MASSFLTNQTFQTPFVDFASTNNGRKEYPIASSYSLSQQDASQFACVRSNIILQNDEVKKGGASTATATATATATTTAPVVASFPTKLRQMLEDSEERNLQHILSWELNGRAFQVHDGKAFVKQILPSWFKQTKIKSFQRQLNLYGFQRINRGEHKGCYVHKYFVRDRPEQMSQIIRKTYTSNTDNVTDAAIDSDSVLMNNLHLIQRQDQHSQGQQYLLPSWIPPGSRNLLEPTPIGRPNTTADVSTLLLPTSTSTSTSTPARPPPLQAYENYFQKQVIAKYPSLSSSSQKETLCNADPLERLLNCVMGTPDPVERFSDTRDGNGISDSQSVQTSTHKTETNKRPTRIGVFPLRLHDLLDYVEEQNGQDIVRWEMNGRAFRVHDISNFESHIMKKFFKLTKFESFQRQLNLYSFIRISRGPNKGCYMHPMFVRGKRNLSKDMQRKKQKEQEPIPEFIQQVLTMDKHESSSLSSSSLTRKRKNPNIIIDDTTMSSLPNSTGQPLPSSFSLKVGSDTSLQSVPESQQSNGSNIHISSPFLSRINALGTHTFHPSPPSQEKTTAFSAFGFSGTPFH